MKKMLMIALLVPFVGLQAEVEETYFELVVEPKLDKPELINKLNDLNKNWVADLNNSGLPWNDRGALRKLFDAVVEYARNGGKNGQQYVDQFNNAAGAVRERLASRSKGAFVRGLRQSERMIRIKQLLSRLNASWFTLLSEYAEGQARKMNESSEGIAVVKGQFPAFGRQVRQLEADAHLGAK